MEPYTYDFCKAYRVIVGSHDIIRLCMIICINGRKFGMFTIVPLV